MSYLLKHKFLDFELPSGTLWLFPTTPVIVTNLTEEERLHIPTIEQYQELFLRTIKQVRYDSATIKIESMHDSSVHTTLFMSQKYATLYNSLYSVIFEGHSIAAMDLIGEYAYATRWDCELIFPYVIKKPQ